MPEQENNGFQVNPPRAKAFPDPSDIGGNLDNENSSEDDNTNLSERDTLLSDMESKIDARREQEINAQVSEFDDDMDQQQAEATRLAAEGLQNKEPITQETAAEDTKNKHLPEEFQDDPLADYIVMDEENNAPMFVTKVDGVDKYIPLDRAKQQLQKHEAAEARMQQAALQLKAVQDREAAVQATEQALAQRAQELSSPPPAIADVSDQELQEEAQKLVESIFTGTADEAAQTMADVLKTVRSPVSQVPQLDEQQIVNRVVQESRQQAAAEQEQLDAQSGYQKFVTEYDDIAGDQNLFNFADNLTETIEAEWRNEGRAFTPSQVMMEAGGRTRAWVQSMKAPVENEVKPENDRHERKRKLRPMPTSQSARTSTGEEEEVPATPQSYLDEIRKARGQGG